MKKGTIFLISLIVCSVFVKIFTKNLYAQERVLENINLRIVDSTQVEDFFPHPEHSFLLIDGTGDPVGFEAWETTTERLKRIIELTNGQRFEVKPLFGTLVSTGGHSILKYGENILEPVHQKMGLNLYSKKGLVLMTNDDLHPDSIINISEDGYFAILGARIDTDNLNHSFLTLYSPLGQELFIKKLDNRLYPIEIKLSNNARTIVVMVSTVEADNNGLSDLMVFNRSGNLINTNHDFAYVNSLVFTGVNEEYLLVFSINNLTLISASNGQIIWKTSKFYRLVGPFGLRVSADQKYLSIVTAELTKDSDNIYIWRANLINMRDGSFLGSIDLKRHYPISHSKVLDWISEQSFNVNTNKDYIFTITFN